MFVKFGGGWSGVKLLLCLLLLCAVMTVGVSHYRQLGCVQQLVAASIVTEMWGGTGDWRTLHNEGLHGL